MKKVIKFFEENLIDGKVYLESYVPWLRGHIGRQKMPVEEFINFFGYEQLINRSRKIIRKADKPKDDSVKYIEMMLEKIKVDQKNKDRIRKIKENEKIIINRDKGIIKDLKELYKGRCQICKNELIPQIIQKDGTVYSEAHHIKQLANAKLSIEEENEVLDNYKNIIVLCPFHHRYVHFNKGGNYELKKIDGKMYLVNEDEKIEIKLDYHLEGN